MTQKFLVTITDSTGTKEVTSLTFGDPVAGVPTSPVRLRVLNAELSAGITTCRFFAARADMLIATPPGEELAYTLRNGGELVDEAWLEARIYGDATWTPLNEYTQYLSLGALPAQTWADIEVRLNIPANALTFCDVDFVLIVRSR